MSEATAGVGPVDEPVRPLAWIRLCSNGGYEGPIADCDSRIDRVRRTSGAWTPLYRQEEMSPDFTDTARAALLWVLWHHQGGSSPIGQPIRFALGMGAHEPLNQHQIAEAKRWAGMTRSTTAEFHASKGPNAAGNRLARQGQSELIGLLGGATRSEKD